ncbi:MAG TPA: hypothetical protein VF511_09625 [Chthoniobacterales bacterium]
MKAFVIASLAAGVIAVPLEAAEQIVCKSPDGKLALRHVYSDQQPHVGETAIIDVATHKVVLPLASDQVSGQLKLVWSGDSQGVAYFDERAQERATRVFFRDGASFDEVQLPELPSPKLPANAVATESGAETTARVEPMQWLKSGELVLEYEVQNRAWGRTASKITIGFDGDNRASVRSAEQEKVSIVDYFLLLPAEQFEGPPSVWLRHARSGGGNFYRCDVASRERYVDEKNGYMKCPGDGAQPSFEVALFRHRDGRPLLALCSGELEGPDSVSLEFFELGADGKMHETKRSIFPVGDSKDNQWQFQLPREGRTVVVRARKGGKILHNVTWNGERFEEQK